MCIIFILKGLFRRIANVLQRMIDCPDVVEGTTSYEGTQEALRLAQQGYREGTVYTRCSRGGHGKGAGRS